MNKVTEVSLNLSPKYVPGWGAWEIAREFICNAIDASPTDHKIDAVSPNKLVITTPTVPTMAQMFMIGEGEKGVGGKTIGQFGEGMKMASLACVRVAGGKVTVKIPGHTITFHVKASAMSYGSECLHATISDSRGDVSGMEVTIEYPGISTSIAGRIYSDMPVGPLGVAHEGKGSLFVKGVYICQCPTPSKWNWNVNDCRINRDRSLVDMYSYKTAIGAYLDTDESWVVMDALVNDPETSLESESLAYCTTAGVTRLVSATMKKYGQNILVSSGDSKVDEYVSRFGKRVLDINSHVNACLTRGGGVKTSESFLGEMALEDRIKLSKVDYSDTIEWLSKYADAIESHRPEVKVFVPDSMFEMGKAVIHNNMMYLSVSLFKKGNEFELLRTYLHELAHIISKSGDETRGFESGLDWVAAQFALKFMPLGDSD